MSTEEDIRKASDKFYAALNSTLNGDGTPMADVWSRNPDVTAMHPIDGIAVGWDEIRASWENFAKISANGRVELRDQRICVGEEVPDSVVPEFARSMKMAMAMYPLSRKSRYRKLCASVSGCSGRSGVRSNEGHAILLS